MLIDLDDIEAFKPGTQITFSDGVLRDRSFVRMEPYTAFEDCWVELGTGAVWHSSKLIAPNETAEATVKPKRR